MTPAVSGSAPHSLPVIFSHHRCTDTVSESLLSIVQLMLSGLLTVCSGFHFCIMRAEKNIWKTASQWQGCIVAFLGFVDFKEHSGNTNLLNKQGHFIMYFKYFISSVQFNTFTWLLPFFSNKIWAYFIDPVKLYNITIYDDNIFKNNSLAWFRQCARLF